jgi:hypothetical protein
MRTKLEFSNGYRTTWEEFVRATNVLQDCLTATAPDPARVELALFEAEKARRAYNAARDLLVSRYLQGYGYGSHPSSEGRGGRSIEHAVADCR